MSFFSVENLGVRFGGVVAVDGVSFSVEQGEVYTIIGPNGAGKTTIFNLIGLIYPPTSGTIRFEDREITGAHLANALACSSIASLRAFPNSPVGRGGRRRCSSSRLVRARSRSRARSAHRVHASG